MAALILIRRLLTPPAVLSTDSRAQSQSNMRGEPVSRILSRSTPLPAQSWAIIHLDGLLPGPSSCQPEPAGLKRPICGSYLALLPVGLAVPSVSPRPRWALTPPFHLFPRITGSLFSVALSLGLPPPGVTRHRAFHGVRTFLEMLPSRDHPTTRISRLRPWTRVRQRRIAVPDQSGAPCLPYPAARWHRACAAAESCAAQDQRHPWR